MLKKKNKQAIDFCRNIMQEVSRSFALTIPLLDKRIREPVMITYLQDRLLDSFEDEGVLDTDYRKKYMGKVVELFNPTISEREQNELIKQVSKQASEFEDSVKKLIKNTDKLVTCFNTLDQEVQKISFRWLSEMDKGMQKYLDKPVETFSELNEYCYYVAGTVGGFLTDLIVEIGNIQGENKQVLEKNFVESGLFLQKVNIIRDIKLDILNHKKHYWPLKELGITESEIIDQANENEALKALEKMVNDVKRHSKALIDYYYAIPKEWSGYKKFYSVNNAMGYATLELIESNTDLFYLNKKLKIKKTKVLKILAVSEDTFLKKAHSVLNEN
ncbi:MAG TPA: squalene/phytoene synthase family protein [Halanaerobiales bacterium]|nr:squalene/phytoene synthase family protein [Halanaerobiales bacterium]